MSWIYAGNKWYDGMYLTDDQMRRCQQHEEHEQLQLKKRTRVETQVKSCQSTMETMLASDKYSDLILVSKEGERIIAHRCLLTASSQSLAEMLEVLERGDWAENKGSEKSIELQMPQSAAAIRGMLRFIYAGKVDVDHLEADLAGMLELSSLHALDALKAACADYAFEALTPLNAVSFVVLSDLHDLPDLFKKCALLIKSNAAITLSRQFKKIEKDNPPLFGKLRVALGLPENEEEESQPKG